MLLHLFPSLDVATSKKNADFLANRNIITSTKQLGSFGFLGLRKADNSVMSTTGSTSESIKMASLKLVVLQKLFEDIISLRAQLSLSSDRTLTLFISFLVKVE